MSDVLPTTAPDRGFSLKAERWLVCLVLFFSLLTLSHSIHDHWYAMDPRPRVFHPVTLKPAPMGYAPNVYRIGVPLVVSVVERVLPFHWSVILTILDVVFGFIGLFALYTVLVDRMSTAIDAWKFRAPVVLAYLAAIALPLNWVVAWARPETMPSMCFLALATCCLLRLRRGAIWLAPLLLLTLFQALTRSDVAMAFGAGLLLTGLLGNVYADFGTRRGVLLTGTAVSCVAVGTQAYLQLVAFPHAVYPPGTPLVQLPYNFSAHNLNVFFIAVAPSAVALAVGVLRRQLWQGTDVLAIAAAAIYLPIWYLVGSTAEVRIFVPFLLLLCVPTARILAAALTGNAFHPAQS